MSFYYKVLVASAQYHGSEALTYQSAEDVPIGSVVAVPMQRQSVLGVVVATATKPAFATKSITTIYDLPPLPSQLITLAEWIRHYYPAPLGMIAQQILPNSLISKHVENVHGLHKPAVPIATLPPLTTEQKEVLDRVDKPDTYLLHGETGSGKTRVYIELARQAVDNGHSALVLTPEIGLTSQLADSFRQVFGERVVVIHSQLTPKERQVVWLTILRSTTPLIIVGPRSGLFTPLPNIGLIVVDESHETAYKQEQAPHYHAVRVASQLARLHEATLILGSATPSISDYFLAKQKDKAILRMREMARSTDKSHVTTEVIDLKDRSQFTRSQYLSDALITSIATSLGSGEQSLLYLNRRGTARVILCNNCGWQAVCPHCDLPLTYHHDAHVLRCHTCGMSQAAPTSCPECGNADIVFKVIGTKAIEDEIKRLFGSANTMRFDTDNKKADRLEQHFDNVRSGKINILIGTQLLAKGLDLPKLSTLGVVIADTSLSFPDFTAQERTYQLLCQVIGRVGRGHSPLERIIVQTYVPNKPIIEAALKRDYESFYQAEIAERKLFNFPPFCHLLKLSCRRVTSVNAQKATEQFLYSLQALRLPISVDGPIPSFHTKAAGKYEWQLVVKANQRSSLLKVIRALPRSGWSYDIDPINLL